MDTRIRTLQALFIRFNVVIFHMRQVKTFIVRYCFFTAVIKYVAEEFKVNHDGIGIRPVSFRETEWAPI